MINDKYLLVNGIQVRVLPYSEKRYNMLADVEKEQQEYFSKNPAMKIAEIPREKRAEWYKRKAEIMWEPQSEYPKNFFESEDFEAGRLKDTEDFFVSRVAYL